MDVDSSFICLVKHVADTSAETIFIIGSPNSFIDHLIMDSIAIRKDKLPLTTLTAEMGNLSKYSFTGTARAHYQCDIVCSGIKFLSDLKALAFGMAQPFQGYFFRIYDAQWLCQRVNTNHGMNKDIRLCQFPNVYLTAWMTIDTEIAGVNF